LKTAQALQGNDIPSFHAVAGIHERLVALRQNLPIPIPEFEMGTAFRASIRLSVKPAIGRIFVLIATFITHGECLHRSIAPVVGQRFDNTVSRSAVGAVREWIPVTAVGRIKHLAHAFTARSNVRRNCETDVFVSVVTPLDYELTVACDASDVDAQVIYT
jgi:hypothetical protein